MNKIHKSVVAVSNTQAWFANSSFRSRRTEVFLSGAGWMRSLVPKTVIRRKPIATTPMITKESCQPRCGLPAPSQLTIGSKVAETTMPAENAQMNLMEESRVRSTGSLVNTPSRAV